MGTIHLYKYVQHVVTDVLMEGRGAKVLAVGNAWLLAFMLGLELPPPLLVGIEDLVLLGGHVLRFAGK